MHEEEKTDPEAADVFGISIADPDVLKATQFVLTATGINLFVLVMELLSAFEEHGIRSTGAVMALIWVLDVVRCTLLVFSGYKGIRRSDGFLLGCFCCISVASGFIAVACSIFELFAGPKGVSISLAAWYAMNSAFFFAMAYASWFLRAMVADGSLLTQRSQTTNTYSLFGIEMMDMKVLKMTQTLFISLGIVVFILGSIVVAGVEPALRAKGFGHAWLLWIASITGLLMVSGYYGVKRSSERLLCCFSCISGSLFFCFTFMLVMTLIICAGYRCPTAAVFCFGMSGLLYTAMRNSILLRRKALEGVILTAPRLSHGVPGAPIGASTPAEGPYEAPSIEMAAP